jgi:hypothetical protein
MSAVDYHFLPGVSFTLDGETLPASELCWAMIAPCGCISAVHMVTENAVTETAAWKVMAGSAAELKRDKARGFTIKMAKVDAVCRLQDCPHDPKWGYADAPRPEGYSWAAHMNSRVLHLVKLEESDGEREWVESGSDGWRTKVASLCEKSEEIVRVWSRKWYRTDGKVECSQCVKRAERLIRDGQVSA